jgi:hypothetical protein
VATRTVEEYRKENPVVGLVIHLVSGEVIVVRTRWVLAVETIAWIGSQWESFDPKPFFGVSSFMTDDGRAGPVDSLVLLEEVAAAQIDYGLMDRVKRRQEEDALQLEHLKESVRATKLHNKGEDWSGDDQ